MAKILIVGCGDVGGRLAVRLAAAGHEVVGLRRSAFTLPGVTALTGDVTAPASLHFPEGLDYMFVLLAPGESGEAAYRRVYLEGTRHVLAALAGQALQRIFWISSSSVYGQDDGSVVDEESPTVPESATARVLLASEALVRASQWPATVVRFSGIYGAGRLRLLRWLESGRPVQASPPQWTNRIHAEDAAGLLAFLLAQDAAGVALEGTYIGTDDAPAPQHEVLDWLADAAGQPRVAHVSAPGVSPEATPEVAMNVAAGAQRPGSGAGGGQNKRLSNARVRALGFRFTYPDYRAGYAEVLRATRETS